MITFKQKRKFEYQLLCYGKNPIFISLLPNNTISKKFDAVISAIQAMSETLGKVFDDYIFNFVNGYQNCDTEDERYACLRKTVNKTLQFSTVFVSVNNINYGEFADESQRTNDSIFFDTKDILKIFKLSQALKIFSIVLNTETGINLENRRAIWNKFISLLKADDFPSKLHKFLEILSINAKKNKIRNYSEKTVADNEDNIDNLILESFNFILYEGLIIHDHKRNPIPFFAGILKNYIKYGGKYKADRNIEFIDDEVDKIEDKISRRESRLKIKADNITLKRLYDISLFYLSRAHQIRRKNKIGNKKLPERIDKVKHNSPFWDTILTPILSKAVGIGYKKFRAISPEQTAVISFYSSKKLKSIFSQKYQNLFRLAYLFPINNPEFRYYRLKNVSQFINATLQFPIKDLSPIGGSRIFILRLIEDFIGKIKSTPFRSICTGSAINNIQNEKLETETIDYTVRYFANGFEEEIKEFKTAVAKDFDRYKDNKIIETKKQFWGKIAKEKKIHFQINSRVPSNDLNESKIDEQ